METIKNPFAIYRNCKQVLAIQQYEQQLFESYVTHSELLKEGKHYNAFKKQNKSVIANRDYMYN